MNNIQTELEATFVVHCISCGQRIREDKQEETEGVCLRCFYEILNNHLHAQKTTAYGEYVSDR